MSENLYGLVNKPPIDEIYNLDLVNKPDILSDDLMHYGILDMHWGVRRYQNPDGTLTDAGKRRLAKRQAKAEKAEAKRAKKRDKYIANPDTKYFNKHLEKFTNEAPAVRCHATEALRGSLWSHSPSADGRALSACKG